MSKKDKANKDEKDNKNKKKSGQPGSKEKEDEKVDKKGTKKGGQSTSKKGNGKRSYSKSTGRRGNNGAGKPGKQSEGEPGSPDDAEKKPQGDPSMSWTKRDNDVEWYKKYPALVEAQSSIIFNKIYGSTYKYVDGVYNSTEATVDFPNAKAAVPGVFVARWYPFNCARGSSVDAINVAAKNMYTYVRHANSGSVNYESSDFFQYLLCAKQLYVMAEQLKRDLRLVLTYKVDNNYAYRAVLRAFGYSDSDIDLMVRNNANYVGRLAVITAQLNTLKIFSDMPLLQRHLWMAANVWKDDELNKATYFAYYTPIYYHYNWADAELVTTEITTGGSTFEVRITHLFEEINNLLAYEDIGIMIGDMLKAYKDEDCFVSRAPLIGETQEAEFSAEMGSQFRNSVILTMNGQFGYSIPTVRIKQLSSDSQLLLEQCSSGWYTGTQMKSGNFYFTSDLFNKTSYHINSYNPPLVCDSDEPNSDEVLVNTRLTYHVKAAGFTTTTGPSQAFGVVEECGTEILYDALIGIFMCENGAIIPTLHLMPFSSLQILNLITAAPVSSGYLFSAIGYAREISFCPNFYWVVIIGSTGPGIKATCIRTVKGKNVIELGETWLKELHQACRLSEFTIPMFKLLSSNS